MNGIIVRKLANPEEVKEMYPLTGPQHDTVNNQIRSIEAILRGDDKRLILIIGPCSADNEDSVIDYISRLVPVQEKVKDKVLIVPRIYTNKPRTTGDGYKGMLHQPDPGARSDLMKGILATRHLHMRAIEETGFACADEMLYPENYQYLDDVLAYVAVGARSVEDQQHRLTASLISSPTGMKNPTSGDYAVMLNAITAATHPHTFIYRGWEVESHGNDYAHAVLRGYTNKHGESQPNYHYEDLLRLSEMYGTRQVPYPAAIIDTNHANSNKNPLAQPRIIKEVMYSMRHSSEVASLVKGFMVESYIVEGRQEIGGGVYGQSITDACLGWDKSERLIYEIADLV
ncbi:MAG: 3-deoxy-7-phosphoheptulonate synthase [Clostridiales bacterium]|nr:3-deoxy-7-phosphoheptulonate synthase [Clostridiales bacterium]